MNLQDWNPLSYFRELGTFTKTLFLVSFIFLAVGVAGGLSPYNRTLILALAMMSLTLAIHYFSHWAYPVRINRPSIKWGSLLRGIVTLAIAITLGWWLWVISGRPTHLP